MKKILVFGGSGFIGTRTIVELKSRGYEPIIFDHHRKSSLDGEIFLGDITDEVAVTEAMAHADGWIHLAAVLGTQETINNPRPAAFVNVVGGLNILEAAAQYDLPGVYICVGNHWMNNTYSISKTTVERFCHMFNNDRNTKVNMVRCVNAYGEGQLPAHPYGSGKVRKITPAFVCRALTGTPIEVYGDGNQVSDMVYVGDVAKALVNSLEEAAKNNVFDKVVEIGPAEHKKVQEVAQLVSSLVEPHVDIVNIPMRPGEVPGAVVTADYSTLELINMSVDDLVPLEEGMRNTVNWYKENWLPGWQNAQ